MVQFHAEPPKKGLVPTEEGGNYFDNKIGGVMKYKYYKRVDSHM